MSEHQSALENTVGSCPHKRWYTGQDAYIEQMVPGFFATHAHTRTGFEWHVCADCGFAKGPFRVSAAPSEAFNYVVSHRAERYGEQLMEDFGKRGGWSNDEPGGTHE